MRNHDEVFLAWAQQSAPKGKCGSVSFEGRKLYSYRACIAELFESGECIISSTKYSNTTSKHQYQAARYACGGRIKIDRLLRLPIDPTDYPPDALAAIRRTADTTAKAYLTSRVAYTKAWRLQEFERLVREADRYAELKGLDERFIKLGITSDGQTLAMLLEHK